MSGHSKWAQIKRQKGVTDTKRGQMFTKLAKAITIAVREGGGIADPESNFKLRLTVDKARSYNMPKENIERAIERGKGGAKGEGFQEVLYEGFGPGGISIIIEAVTDNKQRTSAEVKNILDKNGGNLGIPGSVAYQYQQKGLITLDKDGKSFDDVFMLAAESGAEDIEEAGNEVLVYTEPQDLKKVQSVLLSCGLKIIEAELTRKPLIFIQINDKNQAEKILSFVEKIESLDDVQKVYSNFDIPDNILNEVRSE